MLLLSTISGILLIRVGMYTKFGIILLGLMITFGPWIFLNWRFPSMVAINEQLANLTIYNSLTGRKIYPFELINDFAVESYTRHAFVSPFEEGNKEYIYEFYVRLKSIENKKLFRIVSRERIDKTMQELVKYLDDLLIRQNPKA